MPAHMIAELNRLGVVVRPPQPVQRPISVPVWDGKGECPF